MAKKQLDAYNRKNQMRKNKKTKCAKSTFFLVDLHNRSSEHKNARCFCFLMPFQMPFEHYLKSAFFLHFFVILQCI